MSKRFHFSSQRQNIKRIILYVFVFFMLCFMSFFVNYATDGYLFPFFLLLLIYKNREYMPLNLCMAGLFDIFCGLSFPAAVFAVIFAKAIHDFILPFMLKQSSPKNWQAFSFFVLAYFCCFTLLVYLLNEKIDFIALSLDYILLIVIYPLFSYIIQRK